MTYEYLFPVKIHARIQRIQIFDFVYQKKIVLDSGMRLKDIFKHPRYHSRALVYIEYSIHNTPHMDGTYVIVLRGMDRESLHRCIQYFEGIVSFREYIESPPDNDMFIDAQFILSDKKIEIDHTSFINKLYGVDRNGHQFLYLNHKLITVQDYWRMLCIMNQTMQWFDEPVTLNTVSMNFISEKNFGPDDCLFSESEKSFKNN